ncbi:MAG: hypothetical protein PHD82_08085 [Candidatus Riflebacteria bacterium]|jgi:hypothetical protein|nr:hypothetical protein [Candidatus Riflebacteria bacterium]
MKIKKRGYVFPLILLATISIAFFIITLVQLQSSHHNQLMHLNSYQQALNVAYSVNVDIIGEIREKQWANRFFKGKPVIRTGQKLFGTTYDMAVEDHEPDKCTFNVKIRTTIGEKRNLFYWRQRYVPNMLDFTRVSFPVFFGEFPPELFEPAKKAEIDKLVDDALQKAADNQNKVTQIVKNISTKPTPQDILKELGAIPPGKSSTDIQDSAQPRPAATKPPTKESTATKPKTSDLVTEIRTFIDPLDTQSFPVAGKNICGSDLMIRDAPWGNVIGQIPPYTGGVQVSGLQGDFFEVSYNGKSGYSHINYVEVPGHTPSGIEPPRPPGAPPPL